ncbi:hypothetical protein OZX68_04975 [Streptococcaceae bacterium ESL0729]|nr:hypothetical protein OZX68_04975 [Streptococcaceae bacterium ESL0729]
MNGPILAVISFIYIVISFLLKKKSKVWNVIRNVCRLMFLVFGAGLLINSRPELPSNIFSTVFENNLTLESCAIFLCTTLYILIICDSISELVTPHH